MTIPNEPDSTKENDPAVLHLKDFVREKEVRGDATMVITGNPKATKARNAKRVERPITSTITRRTTFL